MQSLKYLFAALLFFSGLNFSYAQNADLRLLKYINGPVSSADKTWKAVSGSAYVEAAAVPTAMLITGLASHNKEFTVKAFETGASVVIAEGFTAAGKAITRRERPNIAYPYLVFAKTKEIDYSFPSGHTSAVFATATALSLSFPKWYVIAPSFAYATAVGYSRLYLGVHYPTDVLGGAIVGAGSAFLTWKLQKLLNKKYHYH